LTPDQKKELRDKKGQFPKTDPTEHLEDLEKTQEGFRKGGREWIDGVGKTKQKVPGFETDCLGCGDPPNPFDLGDPGSCPGQKD
jgi:hypothetical protein